MHSIRRLGIGLALVALWAGSATSTLAADNGSVDAQVTVATPCIVVTPSVLDFGTVPFGGLAGLALQYTNCGQADENIYGRATDASGPSGTWSLDPLRASCAASPGVNQYRIDVYGNSNALVRPLGLVDSSIELLGSGASSVDTLVAIFMPCAGSDGIGESMSFQITFTATF